MSKLRLEYRAQWTSGDGVNVISADDLDWARVG